MLYPKNIEVKLGFDKVKNLVRTECVSPLGKEFVDKMRFNDRHDQIYKMMAQTAEFSLILQVDSDFPGHNYLDVSSQLKRATTPGSILYEEDFLDILLSLKTIQQILEFFNNRPSDKYPQLQSLLESVVGERWQTGWKFLIADIEHIIDERGEVKDNASPELYQIRRDLIAEESQVKRTLEKIYRTAKNSGWIGEEMTLTVRDGRMVLPILAEHKRKLKGYIHDETSTGNIAFVEPGEVLEANNRIRELQLQERREILKLLEELTKKLRPHIPELERSYKFLGLIDFIRAKAKVAIETESTFPLLIEERIIDWVNARHPILYLSQKAQGRSVVPLTVGLNQDARILVVSGPNAGGKSVMLKAIGLIQYMAQCGMLVPVAADSRVGIFKSMFIDIGDEQSIENDLSTYSSHLTHMRDFLRHTDQDSLFLIDEMGTGTEPSLGGALAEAILDSLNKKGAFGVINTHYTNLKLYADKNEGVINGAMRFDAENLSPLFELEVGKPGNSFAFEVAQKIGLPKKVLRVAQTKLDKNQVNFEKLLKELEIEKKVFAERNISLSREIEELKQRSEQYASLKDFMESDKNRIINQAKEEAKKIIKDSNKIVENTIKEIKESQAEKEATRIAREKLKTFEKEKLTVNKPKVRKKSTVKVTDGLPEPGDYVRIKGQETYGEVLSVNNNNKEAEVQLGLLKSNIKFSRLEKVSRKEYRSSERQSSRSFRGVNLNEKMSEFNFNLDVRGHRGDEALAAVDSLMDDAIMLGYPNLRIVHGKGNGILRTLIRNHLKQYKQVSRMTDEHPDRGGPGVTLVDLN